MRKILILCIATAFGLTADDDPLSHITAESLRGHLSFIASDALEGRATPSRGLDLAAEYIAAQFRRAGLEPAGDDGYFQTATVNVREQNPEGFEMTVTGGGKTIHVDPGQTSIVTDRPLKFDDVPVTTSGQDAAGKVVILSSRGPIPQGARLVLYFGRGGAQVSMPDGPRSRFSRDTVLSPELMEFLKTAPNARMTLHVSATTERPAKVRNVAGILRGSDPSLRDTFVLLTAHYDHLGVGFDGANDDGSGTVSVVEIASISTLSCPDVSGKRLSLRRARIANVPVVPLVSATAAAVTASAVLATRSGWQTRTIPGTSRIRSATWPAASLQPGSPRCSPSATRSKMTPSR